MVFFSPPLEAVNVTFAELNPEISKGQLGDCSQLAGPGSVRASDIFGEVLFATTIASDVGYNLTRRLPALLQKAEILRHTRWDLVVSMSLLIQNSEGHYTCREVIEALDQQRGAIYDQSFKDENFQNALRQIRELDKDQSGSISAKEIYDRWGFFIPQAAIQKQIDLLQRPFSENGKYSLTHFDNKGELSVAHVFYFYSELFYRSNSPTTSDSKITCEDRFLAISDILAPEVKELLRPLDKQQVLVNIISSLASPGRGLDAFAYHILDISLKKMSSEDRAALELIFSE